MKLTIEDAVTWTPEAGIWAVDDELARLSRFGRVLVGIVERLGIDGVPIVVGTATGDADRDPTQLHAALRERWPSSAVRWVRAERETVPMSLLEVGLLQRRAIWVIVELTPGAELAVAASVVPSGEGLRTDRSASCGRVVEIVRGGPEQGAVASNPCDSALDLCALDPHGQVFRVGRWELVLSRSPN